MVWLSSLSKSHECGRRVDFSPQFPGSLSSFRKKRLFCDLGKVLSVMCPAYPQAVPSFPMFPFLAMAELLKIEPLPMSGRGGKRDYTGPSKNEVLISSFWVLFLLSLPHGLSYLSSWGHRIPDVSLELTCITPSL